MKKRRLPTMDVQTLLGRVRAFDSDRGIAHAMKISRTTVKKYRTWLEAEGFVTREPMPTLSKLHQRLLVVFGDSNPSQNHSSIASYRDEIQRCLEQGLRPRIIFQKLNARPGFTASESAVFRLCQKIKASQPPEVFVRIETAPAHKYQILKRDTYCHVWMHSLLQGKIKCEELEEQLPIDKNITRKLYYWAANERLKYRNRAMVIFAYLNQFPQSAIARFLCIRRRTVHNYVKRFKSGGLQELYDLGRIASKKFEQLKYQEAVFKVLHTPPSSYGINRTTWRMEDLGRILKQEGFPISKPYIGRIIKDAGYKYRKAKEVLTSNDPKYREKLQEITRILSNLKPNEKFFSVDEFGKLAIKIYGGRSLVPPGERKTIPQWQKSKGSLIVTGALELSTNQLTHFYSSAKNTDEMIKLLEILLEKYRYEERIYFSWDAASWHASKKLYEKVEEVNSPEYRRNHKSPIVKLAPLPAGAQFLNVIESVFSGMARAIIHNSNYASVEEAMKAIDRHFAERNLYFKKNPKRAGNKIWGMEITKAEFSESNNCKDPRYR